MKQLYIIIACILSGSITLSAQTIAPPEITLGKGEHFYRKQQVTFKSNDTDARIFYTTDGTTPTTESTEYNEDSPLYIDKSATIQAIAVKDNESSGISEIECKKDMRIITIVSEYVSNNSTTHYAMGKENKGTSKGHLQAIEYNGTTMLAPKKFKNVGWQYNDNNTIVDIISNKYFAHKDAYTFLSDTKNTETQWDITNTQEVQTKSTTPKRIVVYVSPDETYTTGYFASYDYNFSPLPPTAHLIDISKGTSRQNLKPNGYGTICMPYDIVVGDRIGAKFYNILGKKKEGKKITLYLEEETGTLEAGVPYIFHNDSENVYMYYLDEVRAEHAVTDFTSRNGLVGNFNDNTTIPLGMYIIHENKIKKCGTGCTINQGYAYIDLDKVPLINEETAKAKNTIKLTNDNTTAIDNVKSKEETNPRYYNIRGQQVASPRKGLYIVNGKKIIMK